MSTKRYFVKLKDTVIKDNHLAWLAQYPTDHATVTHNWDSDFFHGFAGAFSPKIIEILRTHPDIEYIEEDHPATAENIITQSDAPWGLERINQDPVLSSNSMKANHTYTYHSSAGKGVDIYILDSGIYLQHVDFGGRARLGKIIVKSASNIAHGTHVAGIAAGKQYGVAKAANLIDVRVLSPDSLASDIADGMDWVRKQAIATQRPSIANMSLSTPKNQSIDDMVDSLIKAGVHVIVAAGNESGNVDDRSPARSKSAITVGSTNVDDEKLDHCNSGSAIDLFAPGRNIISCGSTYNTEPARETGTSQATPHVSGIVARQITMYGNLPPKDMATLLKNWSVKDILKKIPEGTVNRLARFCIRTQGELTFESDWAEFSVASPRTSLRKIDDPWYDEYSNVTWTPTSMKWGKSGGSFGSKRIRFFVLNDGLPITGSISRGTDAVAVGDQAGQAAVNIADCDYVNKGVLSIANNTLSYSPCPVVTATAIATLSFASNWASVTVETPGACLQECSWATYDSATTLTSKSLQWGSEDASVYASKEIYYKIVSPAPLCEKASELSSIVDITLAHGNDSAEKDDGTGWSQTDFEMGTYVNKTNTDKKINAQRFNNCSVTTQRTFVSLNLKSNWAEFGVRTLGFTVAKDPEASADVYDNITFTDTSLRWGSDQSTTYQSASIPFIIKGPSDFVDIYLAHGNDGEKKDDEKGISSAVFRNVTNTDTCEYVNSELISGDSRNEKVFTDCPMEMWASPATLSVKSNWGEISLLRPGASLRKDKEKERKDSKIYDGVEITSTKIRWGDSTKENYAEKDIPFQILVPLPSSYVDLSISHGNDKSKKNDKAGSASLEDYSYRNYVNNQIVPGSGSNTLVFNGCATNA